MSISVDGRVVVEQPNYKVSSRGKVYPIPKPKGGRQVSLY